MEHRTEVASYSLRGIHVEQSHPKPSLKEITSILNLGEPLISHKFLIRGIPTELADAVQAVHRRHDTTGSALNMRILVMPRNSVFSKTVQDLSVSTLDVVYLQDFDVVSSTESVNVRLKHVELMLDGESNDIAFYAVSYDIL